MFLQEVMAGVGDAFRNEVRKIPLCPGLKAPAEIDSKSYWCYPHLWIGQRRMIGWSLSFNTWMVTHNITFAKTKDGDEEAEEVWELADEIQRWIDEAPGWPGSKAGWTVPLQTIRRILCCVAVANNGEGERSKMKEAFRLAMEDGFWGASKLLVLAQKKSTPSSNYGQSRGGHGQGQQQRGRGFSSNYKGRNHWNQSTVSLPVTTPAASLPTYTPRGRGRGRGN